LFKAHGSGIALIRRGIVKKPPTPTTNDVAIGETRDSETRDIGCVNRIELRAVRWLFNSTNAAFFVGESAVFRL